jgi:DNA-binding NtrC family response regulator
MWRLGRARGLFMAGRQKASAFWTETSAGAVALLRQRACQCRLVIVLAAFLVCGYAAGVLGYAVVTPEIGIRCAFTPVVNHFSREFLYPEDQEGLREDDVILRIGNQRVENWSELLRGLVVLQDAPGEPWPVDRLDEEGTPAHVIVDGQSLVRVEYKRPGSPDNPRKVWCRVGHAPLETLLPSILWFFLKIGLFIVGAMVFWKRPQDRSARQFFLLCLLSFGAYMGGYHWARIVTQPVLLVIFMACSVLLPAVTLHFYLLFPRPKEVLERWPWRVLLTIYGVPLFFLLLFLAGYVRVRWVNSHGGSNNGLVQWLLVEMLAEIYVYFGVAALWYLASVASLIHSYRAAAQAMERNQVKWILFGTGAALVPIGYSLYLALAESRRFGGGAATWPMFFASFLVTVAYTVSIMRYRLMQLDQIISAGVGYFVSSLLVGLAYYGLVFAGVVLGIQVSEGPSLGQVLGVSSTVLLFTVGADMFRRWLMKRLDRRFRREKLQLDRTLQRMREAIEQLVDPPALGRRLLHTSAELLGVGRGAVYLRDGEPALYRLADSLGPPPPLAELSSGCPLVEALREQASVPEAPRVPRSSESERVRGRGLRGTTREGPAERQLQFLGGEVAHALVHEGQLLGLLVLGPPPRVGGYTPEDLNLLTAFCTLTVLALVGAEGHRTIETLNRDLQTKVEKIAEQQRRILALQSQLMSRSGKKGKEGEAEPDGERVGDDRSESPRLPAASGISDRSGRSGEADGSGAELPEGMVGSSPQVQQLMHLVRKVAPTGSVVLLRGESGTGKGLLARAIHDHSPRAGKPFVKVHCAALSTGLLESELFGHVKGAFTNAIRDKVGRFEAANGGTLFLDEIGDVSPDVQVKLLRVLQEKTFERVGSSESLKVDVRILAATHQDLESLMRQGRFREDLFFRLNVFPITLPPLRERVEDIAELALYFLRHYGKLAGKQVEGIDDDALARLKAHDWPGNIRQLENFMQRAVVVTDKPTITLDELPEELSSDSPLPASYRLERSGDYATDTPGPLDTSEWDGASLSPSSTGILSLPPGTTSLVQRERAERERREREQLVRALAAAGGNKAEAARALGMARSTFVSRLKRHGLS